MGRSLYPIDARRFAKRIHVKIGRSSKICCTRRNLGYPPQRISLWAESHLSAKEQTMRRNSRKIANWSLIASEILEPRRLLTDFPVLNTNDTGADSLRAAIDAANTNSGPDTISFNISGTGLHTINVASTMQIKEALTINGYTQNGASANTLAT